MAIEGKLTPKQESFIQEYLIDLNATQAAIRAGYKPKAAAQMGAENLTKPNIKTAIEQAQTKLRDERLATAYEVEEFLTSVLRGEIQDVSIKERIKSAEILAKRHGLHEKHREEQEAQKIKITLETRPTYPTIYLPQKEPI